MRFSCVCITQTISYSANPSSKLSLALGFRFFPRKSMRQTDISQTTSSASPRRLRICLLDTFPSEVFFPCPKARKTDPTSYLFGEHKTTHSLTLRTPKRWQQLRDKFAEAVVLLGDWWQTYTRNIYSRLFGIGIDTRHDYLRNTELFFLYDVVSFYNLNKDLEFKFFSSCYHKKKIYIHF